MESLVCVKGTRVFANTMVTFLTAGTILNLRCEPLTVTIALVTLAERRGVHCEQKSVKGNQRSRQCHGHNIYAVATWNLKKKKTR